MNVEGNTIDFAKYKKVRNLKKTKPVIIGSIIIIIIILAFVMPQLIKAILGRHIEETKVSIETEAGISFDANTYNQGIAILNSQGIKRYDSDANLTWENPIKFQNPVFYEADKYSLLTEKGGSEVYLVYKDVIEYTFKTNEPVQFATVNNSGFFAVVTEERGYKSLVSVYDSKGEEIYKWYSAENYIVDVDISPDNKAIAIATFESNQNTVTSKVLVFNFNSDTPVSENLYEGNLVFDLKFHGNNSIMILGDYKAVCIKKNGESKWEIEYNGRQIHTYDIDDPNVIVLVMSQMSDLGVMGNGSEVNIYNQSGKKIGSFSGNGKITSVDQMGGKIIFNSRRELCLISKRGRKLASGVTSKDVNEVKLLEGGNKFMATTGTSIDVYKVKLGR